MSNVSRPVVLVLLEWWVALGQVEVNMETHRILRIQCGRYRVTLASADFLSLGAHKILHMTTFVGSSIEVEIIMHVAPCRSESILSRRCRKSRHIRYT